MTAALAADQIIDTAFLSAVLKPYRTHCRYLQSAQFNSDEHGMRTEGCFSIGDSCYIDDTGHFNAVEFNICYNQIAYAHLGHCIRYGLIAELAGFDQAAFLEKQLSHFLIASLSSRFKRPLRSTQFFGVFSVAARTAKAKCTFLETDCRFYDDQGGRCQGQITLAVLHP